MAGEFRDAFGRIIKIDKDISELKAQLLSGVKIDPNFKAQFESPQKEQDNQDKIAKSLEKITGWKLDEELTKLRNVTAQLVKEMKEMKEARQRYKQDKTNVGNKGLKNTGQAPVVALTSGDLSYIESAMITNSDKIVAAIERCCSGKAAASMQARDFTASIGGLNDALYDADHRFSELTSHVNDSVDDLDKAEKPLSALKRRFKGFWHDLPLIGESYSKALHRDTERLYKEIEKIRTKAFKEHRDYTDKERKTLAGHRSLITSKQLELTEKGERGERRGLAEHAAQQSKAKVMAPEKYIFAKEGGAQELFNDIAGGIAQMTGFLVKKIGSMINPIVGGLAGGIAEGILRVIAKPMIENFEFLSDASSYFFTQYGSSLKDIQSKVTKFNTTEQDIIETGQSDLKIRKARDAALKKGIRDENVALKVSKAGLQTATLIGSDAEQTADAFADWNRHLGLTHGQLTNVTRDMVMISRQTGLMGNNLLEVAKQSKEFLQNMRLSGTFTAKAASNIMGLLAGAERTGTSAGMQKLLQVLQGGITRSQNTGVNSMMYRIAGGMRDQKLMNQLLTGTTLNDPAAMKKLGEGMGREVEGIIMRFTGGKKRTVEELTPEEAGYIDNFIIGPLTNFELKLKEVSLMAANLKERGKTFGDRLEDLNKKAKKTITAEDKTAMANQRRDLINQQTFNTIDEFSRTLNTNGQNVDDALNKVKENLQPLYKELGIKSGGAAGIKELLKQRITAAQGEEGFVNLPKALQEALKTANVDKLVDNLRSGKASDKEKFDDLMALISRVNNDMLLQQRQDMDPLLKMQQSLNQLAKVLSNISFDQIVTAIPQIKKIIEDNMPVIRKWIEQDLGPNIREFSKWLITNGPDVIKKLTQLVDFGMRHGKELAIIAATLIAMRAAGGVGAGRGAGIAALVGLGFLAKEEIDQLNALEEGIKNTGKAAREGARNLSTDTTQIAKDLDKLDKDGLSKLEESIYDLKKAAKGGEEALNNSVSAKLYQKIVPWGEAPKTEGKLRAQIAQAKTEAARREVLLKGAKEMQGATPEQRAEIKQKTIKQAYASSTPEIATLIMEQKLNPAEKQKAIRAYETKKETIERLIKAKDVQDAMLKWGYGTNLWHSPAKATEEKTKLQTELDNLVTTFEGTQAFKEGKLEQLEKWTKSTTKFWQKKLEENHLAMENLPFKESYLRTAIPERQKEETLDQALVRKSYGLTKDQQQKLGINNFQQLNYKGSAYGELSEKLYTGGASEDTLNFIRENLNKFSADVVREMFKSYGAELPKGLEDKMPKKKLTEDAASATINLDKKAGDPNCLYVHDKHAEPILASMADRLQSIDDVIPQNLEELLSSSIENMLVDTINVDQIITPMLPGVDVDEEIKKREAAKADNTSMANVENNTQATAQNTARTVKLLAQLGKILMQRVRSIENGEAMNEGDEVFLDEILAVEWPNARYGKTVGIEMSLTDLA